MEGLSVLFCGKRMRVGSRRAVHAHLFGSLGCDGQAKLRFRRHETHTHPLHARNSQNPQRGPKAGTATNCTLYTANPEPGCYFSFVTRHTDTHTHTQQLQRINSNSISQSIRIHGKLAFVFLLVVTITIPHRSPRLLDLQPPREASPSSLVCSRRISVLARPLSALATGLATRTHSRHSSGALPSTLGPHIISFSP